MRVSNKQIIVNGDVSGDITSEAYILDQVYGYSVQAVFTGSPDGIISLEASCDPGPSTQVNPATNLPTNWTQIASSSQTVNASGVYMWNVDLGFYEWVRVVYVDSSGGTATGTLTVTINTKGV